MRNLLFLFLLLPAAVFAQRSITLEDIWKNNTFKAQGIPGFNFQKDGIHYTRLQTGGVIEQCDIRTGAPSGVLFNPATIKTDAKGWDGTFDAYGFNADESKMLLAAGIEQIYRWSMKAHYFVFDANTQSVTRLHDGPKQRYATFSPDNAHVAFVCDNNLFFKNLSSGKTTQITQDGQQNAVINGAADWVYEEEFEITRAYQWSPDARKIAFLRFDESKVPEYTLELYKGGAYPEEETFKYPKVGQPNSVVTAWMYDLATGKTTEVQTGAGNDDYLPRIEWTPSGKLCLTWMNRHQNELKLMLADAATGACTTLYEESNERYIDLHDVVFLKDGSGFVLQSEKDGYNHLYYYNMSGKQEEQLTDGKYDVTDFYGVDEANGWVFYQTAAKNAMQREVFSVKLNGKKRKNFSKKAGHNAAQFSSTFDYYVNTYSTINTPPMYAVFDRDGKMVRALETNDGLQGIQKEFAVQPVEFFDFKTSDEVQLNGWMIRPNDPALARQKLPVLMFVYGGPGSQQVLDQWKGANYWWFQMLAQKGYVVACVDNRGTGARGEEFKKMTYLNLGKYEVQDQIESAKYMGSLDFVDKNRIGIFGWSYGGFMSTNCILKGEEIFKAAIAVAPVTNWKWYDSVYTERYMQTEAENPQGYAENSPVNYADRLKGNYLLVHGTADDNVHFQHTAEMANQLIAANKQFETMIYPNRNHGINGDNARLHLYTLMTQFLEEKLKGVDGKVVRP